MIHHWKVLDLEITDFEYQHDRTLSGKIIPSQTSTYVLRQYYFIMRDRVEHPTSGASQKKAKLEELSNFISDRSEA